MILRICAIFLLFVSTLCVEFHTFEGKFADPCAKFLDPTTFNRDCPINTQLPSAAVTVLIPSETSAGTGRTAAANQNRALIGASLTTAPLTIFGNQFPSTTQYLALSTNAESCETIDTAYQVLPAQRITTALGSGYFGITFTLATQQPGALLWNSATLEAEDRPRLLCYAAPSAATIAALDITSSASVRTLSYVYTGFKIGVVWNCETESLAPTSTKCPPSSTLTGLNPIQQLLRTTSRTLCCKNEFTLPNAADGNLKDRNMLYIPGATIKAGQCVNPNVQGCCGAAAFEISTEKCCKGQTDTFSNNLIDLNTRQLPPTDTSRNMVVTLEANCPCSRSSDCPSGEKCCLPTKYSELDPTSIFTRSQNFYVAKYNALASEVVSTDAPYLEVWPWPRGECYRPIRQRCCDTGSVFDPGSHQCCRINGVQSINAPCPCGAHSDCISQHYPVESRSYNYTCCMQTHPAIPTLTVDISNAGACSIYANYPSGQGNTETQRCLGVCIDTEFQFCCNGAICMANYETCCNSTCCNIWTSTCFIGLRSGSPGNRYNSLYYNGVYTAPENYEICSSIEHITTIKGFWIFVLPSMLLLASHVGLALVLVFAAKATPRSYSKIEYAMMLLAFAIIYLSMPLYFAPVWKYPIWVIFAQLLVFLTATARIRWLNVLCVVIQAVTLIYLFDPFHGNAWLTLSSNRVWNTGVTAPDDVMTSGVLHAITRSWHTVDLTATQRYCSNFYDYFRFDPQMRDFSRVDNPQITMFGYCSRGWVTALLIFSFFLMSGVLVQMILCLMGIFFRFHSGSVLHRMEEEYFDYDNQ